MDRFDVIVIGAGAAGLIAAGRLAENGASVLLIEKNEKAAKKLFISGKGRCNITNQSPQSEYFKNIFPSGKYLKHAFGIFFNDDIINLLAKLGVKTKLERGNRVFPVSDKSSDVVNALLKYNLKNNVQIKYNCSVQNLIIENNTVIGVQITENNNSLKIFCNNVVLCTGGKSYPATGSMGDGYIMAKNAGHTIINPSPALVPLTVTGNVHEKLNGLTLKNINASLWVNGKKSREEFGELLFESYGLDGPVILTLSKFALEELNKKNTVKIAIDLKPALNEQKLDARLQRDLNDNGKMQIENVFKLLLPIKMIPVFLDVLKIEKSKKCNQISSNERKQILRQLKNFEFEVTGSLGFKKAIVTAGGVSLNEIDGKTLQSKIVKNLYFAGEIIDLDANTGGYNLQIAFSTAWLAAESISKKQN